MQSTYCLWACNPYSFAIAVGENLVLLRTKVHCFWNGENEKVGKIAI